MLASKTDLEAVTENNNQDRNAYHEAAVALRASQLQSKERMRKKLANLSFTEKIKILERLRDREKAIAAAGLRRMPKDSGAEF